ncbi:pyrophosphatase PpaX [Xylanibacillus composti]|uniref:Haloacid dehalogenase n=1 Tax=Xylanibacillus composti TaxID=1572762 RepID=A0A8J4M4R7_9BACL|nr:pyrophosphatase PpaX [Xylanibacillus composti]MDT9725073.1 pyrophosphatase PpaX [Xylanibacillus composti]GIQ71525.1 haloacid dehalogenase [Xylanibacillus composti]
MGRTVLFDLDGTILDTNELIIESFQHVFREHMSKEIAREALIQQMGRPLDAQLRFFSGRTEAEEVDDLRQAYRTYNVSRHDELVTAFPHTREVLDRLKREGVRLGVVTSKVRMTTERGLRHCGLYEFMEAIVTVEDVVMPKPHPEAVQKAMQALDAEAGQTWMVGDSPYDVEAAKLAGVQAIGVGWSLKGTEVLRAAGADFLINDMRELYTCVLDTERNGQS